MHEIKEMISDNLNIIINPGLLYRFIRISRAPVKTSCATQGGVLRILENTGLVTLMTFSMHLANLQQVSLKFYREDIR
jgi:hypothetical protein